MPYGPGKFEGEPASTFLLYERSLDSDYDEEFSHENFGWWCRFDSQLQPHPDEIEAAKNAGYTDVEISDALITLSEMTGAILHENDQGFVHADLYNANADSAFGNIDRDWSDLQQEYGDAEGAAE